MLFWDNFVSACKLRGMSPTSACKAIGLSNAVPTYWKQGALPKADAIAAVADLLGVSADYLLGRSDRVSTDLPSEASDAPQVSAYEQRLLDAYRELSIEDKMYFLGRVEEAARQDQKKEA